MCVLYDNETTHINTTCIRLQPNILQQNSNVHSHINQLLRLSN